MPPIAKNKKQVKNKLDTTGEKVVSAQLQKKLDEQRNLKKKPRRKPERGVVLLRHIPKGFFEEQIKDYFAQFGDVTRVRLARSRKTGGIKCFAFIEFKIPDVAKIAAEAMDNYLMFQKLVKAHYIPPEQQKYDYFRTKVRRVINPLGKAVFTSRKIIGKIKKVKKHNMWSNETYSQRMSKSLKKFEKIKNKYLEFGLDLDSILIKPKLAVLNDSDLLKNGEGTNVAITSEVSKPKPGSLLLVKKKKLSCEEKSDKKIKQKSSLEQLLADTINDSDSIDEDYLPIQDYNPNETLKIPPNFAKNKTLSKKLKETIDQVKSESDSDESYKPPSDYNGENESEVSGHDFEENSVVENYVHNCKSKNTKIKENFGKVTHLDKIICRKPLSGGVTKKIVKPKTQSKESKLISNIKLGKMKAVMIKEIAKGKNLKKVKKSDLKIKNKVK